MLIIKIVISIVLWIVVAKVFMHFGNKIFKDKDPF